MASKAKLALDRLVGRSGGKRRGDWAPIFLRKSGGWRKGQFKVWTPRVFSMLAEVGRGVSLDYVPPDRKVTTEIRWMGRLQSYPTKSKAQAEARKVAASLRKAIGMELRMMFGHEQTQAQLKRAANAMVKVLKG